MDDAANPLTERLLRDAGVAEGMRVLDFGCGWGALSRMVADRVGPSGMVLGVDHDASALATARERTRMLGLTNVVFTDAGPTPIAVEHPPFDAIVGRRVLMYLPDPATTLKELVSVLRPGGLVCFAEHDATLTASVPAALPVFSLVRTWIWDTIVAEGGNAHMGFDLYRTFERAGLVVQALRAEAVVHLPHTPSSLAVIVRAMLPRIVARGIATDSEIDIGTLDQRLTAERVAAQAVSVGELVFGAWARKPA